MSTSEKVRQLAESYQELSHEERRDFAMLVAPEDTEALSPEWTAEVRSRAEEIDSGKVKLVAGDDFLRRLKAL